MEWKELKTEMSAYENFDVRKNYIAFDSELKYNNIRRSNFKSDYQNVILITGTCAKLNSILCSGLFTIYNCLCRKRV